jgi:hypothetical protein
VCDNRLATLTRYRRAIINVPGGSEGGDLQPCKFNAVPPAYLPQKPITSSGAPHSTLVIDANRRAQRASPSKMNVRPII